MRHFVKWLEDYLLPWASRLGQVRWLVALRNAFVSVIPITVAGSMAVLIKGLVAAARSHLGLRTLAFIMGPLVAISNVVWRGTFALFALFLVVALGYQLATTFETNRLAGSIIALASFMMSVANYMRLKVDSAHLTIWHAFDISQFSTTGIFTALLFGSVGYSIYFVCVRARLTFHLRNNVPQAEEEAFASLLPGIIAIFGVGALNYLFQLVTGTYFGNWLLHSIQMPLIRVGQGFGMVLLVTFLVQVLWFFGLNGIGILAPILDSVWLTAQNLNVMAARNGHVPRLIWTRGSFDAFAWFGGAGGTLVLIIAILLFSKRSDYRTIAKIALAPGLFNINEPVIFGLPVVLNPVYFIPFVFVPVINVALAYWVTVMGLVNPVQVGVPSVVPPIIAPFLACNYDWRAIVWSGLNMLIALALWAPFVFAADKIASNSKQPRRFFNSQY